MSHEMLRKAAEHLQHSTNPAYVEGGKKLGEVADILLEHDAIPLSDPGIVFIVRSEGSILGPLFVARDFELETATRRLFGNAESTETLTVMEFKLLERILMEPGVDVPRDKILEHMYGFVDDSGMDTFKSHLLHLRRKLPVDARRAEEIIETIKRVGLRYNHFEKEE